MTIIAIFSATVTISVSAWEFLAESGLPAVAFAKAERPVADIVSPICRDEKERDDAGEPTQLVQLLGIKLGMTVVDIGTGSGYYVVRLSPVVGPHGHIIAEDVVPDYLRNLGSRVRDLGLQNVAIGLGEPHHPRFLLIRSTLRFWYTCITRSPSPNLVPALKVGARVGIVDSYGPTSEHGTPPELLRCELAAAVYRENSFNPLIGSNAYLAIFAPPSVVSRTRPEDMVACKAP